MDVTHILNSAIRNVRMELLLGDIEIKERLEVKIKPNFDTACWAYLPPHRIYLGDKAITGERVRTGLSKEDLTQYAMSYGFHEYSHLRHTERDLEKLNVRLQGYGIPFSLLNLFEDARIEDSWRKLTGRLFGWTKYEYVPEATSPATLFFLLIQHEGEWRDDWNDLKYGDAVNTYYRMALECGSTWDLIPLLQDWVAIFGKEPPKTEDSSNDDPSSEQSQPGGKGTGSPSGKPINGNDLAQSLELMNPAALAEFDKDAKEIGKGPSPGPDSVDTGSVDIMEVAGNGNLLQYAGCEVDLPRAEKLAARLARLFEKPSRWATSEEPGKRLSAKDLGRGDIRFKHKSVTARSVRNKVAIVVDCSGSMGGYHMHEARVLLAAFSLLARSRMLDGHVILSAVENNRAMYQTFKLPVPVEGMLDRLEGFASAEGLEDAIRSNIKLLKEMDKVFVFTDGCICDRPVDKAWLHRQGVKTVGVYCGPQDVKGELLKYFDKACSRETVEQVADAILLK